MKPKIGLLPLYLKLYDDTMPEVRAELSNMLLDISDRLIEHGVEVIRAEICRVRDEIAAAVARFESEEADLIISVHLAYSPSLEAADILAHSYLPILMLDTTLDARFPQNVDPARLMYNHGIHGVQDLASVLRRMGKRYEIVAGHCEEPRLFEEAAQHARGARAARFLRTTRAVRIGDSFEGMGDFAVPDSVLQDKLGIQVEQVDTSPVVLHTLQVTKAEIEKEYNNDRSRYDITAPDEAHRRSIRVGLGLRKFLENNEYTAFSMNFLAFNQPDGPVDTVPFLEASKAMARGIGYAGEGDVLTASLVGALQRGLGDTTFTEIFCPDWKTQSLFISHMGEVNPAIAATKPHLCEKDFPWTPAHNPAILACAPKPGPGILVNIAPGPDDSFSLIFAEVNIEPEIETNQFKDWVRGWISPTTDIRTFLEQYSRAGGTHHCALVLGDRLPDLRAFAAYAGLESTILR